MTLQEMRDRKQELGYSNEQLAELTGVPLSTIQKVMGGITKSPRRATIEALERILSPERAQVATAETFTRASVPQIPYAAPGRYAGAETGRPSGRGAHSAGARRLAGQAGKYTMQDLFALPENTRAELIDGEIYYMTSPALIHQLILFHFHNAVWQYIKAQNGSCIPISAPMDVQLDEDDRTVVQPDFMILCDKEKVKEGIIFGAPDFIMEVLSPATRKKDVVLKTYKYMNAGVREYWLIDPGRQQVMVYNFMEDELPVIYGFDADIPVAIYDGKLRIDMQQIRGEINFQMS